MRSAFEWKVAYLREAADEIAAFGNPGEEVTYAVDMLRLGEGLTFWPWLSKSKTFLRTGDPVNLVLWGDATIGSVNAALSLTATGWGRTVSAAMFAYIDDSEHAGDASWKKPGLARRVGPIIGTSNHIRVYTGSVPCTHGRGMYCIGGMHRERFDMRHIRHKILDWDRPRNELLTDLSSNLKVDSNSVQLLDIGNAGVYENVRTDGRALYAKVLP